MYKITISFSIQFETTVGHRLVLCGNVPYLGAWNVARGLVMDWNENNVWSIDWEVPWRNILDGPREEYIDLLYKYAIVDGQGQGVGWESEGNHKLSIELLELSTLKDNHTVYVRDIWNGGLTLPTLAVSPHHEASFKKARSLPQKSVVVAIAAPGSLFGVSAHNMVVVGSTPELGLWDVSKGLKMEVFPPVGSNEELWIGTLPHGYSLPAEIEYKYVICSKHNNGVMWESGPNRVIKPPYAGEWPQNFSLALHVDGNFRKAEHSGEGWISTGYMGIINTFASCSINSVIQLLYHIPNFRQIVMESRATGGRVTHALSELFKNLDGAALNFTVKDLVSIVGLAEDPHEFINLLLFDLKSELGSAHIDKIFVGREKYHQRKADSKTEREEDFLGISLDVEGFANLKSSFAHYQDKSITGAGGADACEHFTELVKLPPVFIIHLNRVLFDPATKQSRKITQRFEYPLELVLDNIYYRLIGVIVHRGGNSPTEGHYYAFLNLKRVWYRFDDEHVHVIVNKEEVLKHSFGGKDAIDHAYLLVYSQEEEESKRYHHKL